MSEWERGWRNVYEKKDVNELPDEPVKLDVVEVVV